MAAAMMSVVPAGLASSCLSGQKLVCKQPSSSASSSRVSSTRVAVTTAKYGEKNVYFDLEDIGNTTGSWDLYGNDAPSPYNKLQSQFFTIAAAPFTKRGLLLKFLLFGGAGTIAYLSATVDPELLPIKKGPVGPPPPRKDTKFLEDAENAPEKLDRLNSRESS